MKISALKSHNELLQKDLKDPAFREKWEQSALARAVALRLASYRAEQGISQTQLAEKLGMKQPAIARLERGERNPTWETLARLSGGLGIDFLVDIAPRGRSSVTKGQERAAGHVEKVDSGAAAIVVAIS